VTPIVATHANASHGVRMPSIPATQSTLTASNPIRTRAIVTTLFLNAVTPLLLIMTTIAEPEMGRSLGIPASEDVWLAESIIAAQISLTPLSGFLIARLGVVSLLRLCILGISFTGLLSVCVGLLDSLRSLPLLTGLIFLQGAFVAPLTPATQVLIVTSHSTDERARGMAVWTSARYLGFLAGSLLAGWIAQSFAWPLIFAVAPLVAVTSLFWLSADIDAKQTTNVSIDWQGFIFLVTTVVALQLLLNLDNNSGRLIPFLLGGSAVVAVVVLPLLLHHLTRAENPIVSLQPLQNRWFATAVVLSFGINVVTTGQFEILLLGSTLHVSPEVLGLRSAFGGLAQIAGVLLVGYGLKRERLTFFLSCSILILLLGLYSYTWYGPNMSAALAIWTRVASGFGIGLCTASLAVAAFDSLPDTLSAQAASLLALASALGTEFGLAGLNVIFRSVNHVELSNELHAYLIILWVQVFGLVMMLPSILFFRDRSATAPKVTAQTVKAALP
jgi:MFS transporter, DHA2 family, multidrug resistance protein